MLSLHQELFQQMHLLEEFAFFTLHLLVGFRLGLFQPLFNVGDLCP